MKKFFMIFKMIVGLRRFVSGLMLYAAIFCRAAHGAEILETVVVTGYSNGGWNPSFMSLTFYRPYYSGPAESEQYYHQALIRNWNSKLNKKLLDRKLRDVRCSGTPNDKETSSSDIVELRTATANNVLRRAYPLDLRKGDRQTVTFNDGGFEMYVLTDPRASVAWLPVPGTLDIGIPDNTECPWSQ